MLWMLWDAFFTTVATTSTSHVPLLALYLALKAQPPTQPKNAGRQLRSYTRADGKLDWATLPRFGAQWRDVHDILEARRDWDGVCASGGRYDEYYLRFCVFSALLLQATNGKGESHPVWVFYACRNVLECKERQLHEPKAHRISPEQVRALDVRVAATWVRDGSRALWETDHGELRQHWATALDEKTELWPREDGLTRDRWRLWEERLRALNLDDDLDMETKKVTIEAAEVIDSLLRSD